MDFEKQTAEEVYRLWAAIYPLVGIHATFLSLNRSVRLVKIEPPDVVQLSQSDLNNADYTPGMVKFDKIQKLLFIKCKKGWVGVSRVQFPTKKVVSAEAFAATHSLISLKSPSHTNRFVVMPHLG